MADFPMDAVIFNKIVEVFNQTRRYVPSSFSIGFFYKNCLWLYSFKAG